MDMPIEIEMFLTNFGSSCFSRFLIGQRMQLIVFLIISTVNARRSFFTIMRDVQYT